MTRQELEEQRERLGNRSSKIIGGYVTEHLFIESFLKEAVSYSGSWWFSKTKEGRFFWFIEKRNLSELDWQIVGLLKARGQTCYLLWQTEGFWQICETDTGRTWTLEAFISQHALQRIPKVRRQVDLTEDEILQLERCIGYYRQENMLADLERSISIEDLFLNQYFYTSNIDLFVREDNGMDRMPLCLEIKFKDEFLFHGTPFFGMDCYQLETGYRLLEQAGIKIFNVILYNDSRDTSRKTTTSIFEYLKHSKSLQWKYARVSQLVKYEKYYMQSRKTTFTGTQNKSRPVYCIPMSIYADLTDIGQLSGNTGLLDAEGHPFDYDGEIRKRCPLCDSILKERNGIHGKFLGCSRYPQCRYTTQWRGGR